MTFVLVTRGIAATRVEHLHTPTRRLPMLGFIALLLVVWLALVVIGALVEGLFWLIAIGAVLFVATAVYGWVKRNTTRV
jgi:phosphotransferase system  glucose/maltose/N-acetylglucosamine-specific IIC component